MTKAVIINGSNSKNSRVTAIHEKVENHFIAQGVEVHSNYIHELPATDLLTANFSSKQIQSENEHVKEADFIVILTPIAVGGSISHLLALEYALKPVLAVLGATSITNSVYIVDKQIIRLEEGGFAIEEEAISRLEAQLNQLQQAFIVN